MLEKDNNTKTAEKNTLPELTKTVEQAAGYVYSKTAPQFLAIHAGLSDSSKENFFWV